MKTIIITYIIIAIVIIALQVYWLVKNKEWFQMTYPKKEHFKMVLTGFTIALINGVFFPLAIIFWLLYIISFTE